MIFEQVRKWMFTIDPIHVGSGRQQVTRIDLPLVRENGTNLPVVPGSSITGVCRSYSALGRSNSAPGTKTLDCAGKGGGGGEKHCGECAICFAFGFSKGEGGKSRQGLVQISTAHILFFPIASSSGPVWITCEAQLSAAGLESPPGIPTSADGFRVIRNGDLGLPAALGRLDLAWVNLEKADDALDRSGWVFTKRVEDTDTIETAAIPDIFSKRITRAALVPDPLFYELVNDNTEVRTLVSIDPTTGAAAHGALFTYEAIPRGTLLWFDLTYTDPVVYGRKVKGIEENAPEENLELKHLKEAVNRGFKLMKYLGLGGMNTRGLGRIDVWNDESAESETTTEETNTETIQGGGDAESPAPD